MADPTDRGVVALTNPDAAAHRRDLAQHTNDSLSKSGADGMRAPLRLVIYTVAELPDATLWTGGFIFVSDEAGGAVTAFSDGTDWRRTQDRVVVS